MGLVWPIRALFSTFSAAPQVGRSGMKRRLVPKNRDVIGQAPHPPEDDDADAAIGGRGARTALSRWRLLEYIVAPISSTYAVRVHARYASVSIRVCARTRVCVCARARGRNV